MLKYLLIGVIGALAACTQLPQPASRAPVEVGQTTGGKPILRFQLTRSSALGLVPVSDQAIAARAAQICPDGYTQLARSGAATRRISGVIYTDVKVTIACH